MEIFQTNLRAGTTRRAMLNGREHIVAPLTLIVPGVLNGSKGALYYPHEEISKDPSIWNGTPIVVYHPTRNGNHVSARDPDVLDKQGIGVVLRSQAKGKLTAEGWFDVEATQRVDPRVLASLRSGKKIELSTGLFTENEPTRGTFNGRPYDAVARNYKPDHLAILPDQVGACSVKDGCGVMVNSGWQQLTTNCDCATANKKKQPSATADVAPDKACQILKDGTAQGHPLTESQRGMFGAICGKRKKKVRNVLTVNQTAEWKPVDNCGGYDIPMMVGQDGDDGSYMSMDHQVRRAFSEANPTQYDSDTGSRLPTPYVVAVFEDHLIYRDGKELYRMSWSLDEAGTVSIGDEGQQVRKDVQYVPVDNAQWQPISAA